MKLWPRSMASQLAAFLLLGLSLTQIIAMMLLGVNADLTNPIALDRDVERVIVAYHDIQYGHPSQKHKFLEVMESEGSRFEVVGNPSNFDPEKTSEELRIEELMSQRLSLKRDEIHVQVRAPESNPLEAFQANVAWAKVELDVFLKLPDGTWLHSSQQTLAAYQWWRLLRFSVPLSTLPALFIALVFTYYTLRPIKALAKAVERASHGERIPPLPAIGPSEARELSTAFNVMQSNMVRFIEDRTQMLAAISHDFRTPITSLRIRAAMIEDAETRDAMTKTLEDMSRMVEETLSFAHGESILEEVEDVDLRDFLSISVEEFRAAGKDVFMEPGESVVVRVRKVSLRRAVQNILDNAIRYGDNVCVRLLMAQGVIIEVDDNGPGIEPENLDRVFEPFVRLDPSRNTAQGCVGLGLSIARSCTRSLGGDVTLANLPNGGLRATIRLP